MSDVYIPIYSRAPNKLLRYEIRQFEDLNGLKAEIRWAIFLDKKGQEYEMIAQVKWDKQ